MRLIRMHDIELPAPEQVANLMSGRYSKQAAGNGMYAQPRGPCPFTQRGALCRNQLCFVPSISQSLQQQQCLVLPTAPFGL
jgi:hypothetical protein